jgi:hypothetical protein
MEYSTFKTPAALGRRRWNALGFAGVPGAG